MQKTIHFLLLFIAVVAINKNSHGQVAQQPVKSPIFISAPALPQDSSNFRFITYYEKPVVTFSKIDTLMVNFQVSYCNNCLVVSRHGAIIDGRKYYLSTAKMNRKKYIELPSKWIVWGWVIANQKNR